MMIEKNELKIYEKKLKAIDTCYQEINGMNSSYFKRLTYALMERYKSGESLDLILPSAFALCKEAVKQVLGKEYYDTQLLAGMILHDGRIAEMKTGEGKTLVSVLPAYLNALTGNNVHITTVNSYLAKRDKELLEPVFQILGMTVGLSIENMSVEEKQKAYRCNVTFSVNSELGFDFLRDNIVLNKSTKVLNGLHYIIIDESDSILIDEAVVPLIISGTSAETEQFFNKSDMFVKTLIGEDYEIEDDKAVYLTDKGLTKLERFFDVDTEDITLTLPIMHCVNNSLKANYILKRDVDYVMKDGEVVIVDQNTGRLAIGRKYSAGLHQAIEAKENVTVHSDNRTVASITYQSFFNMYEKICGMTGTGKSDESEFKKIYNLDVVEIPTYRPIKRIDETDIVFETAEEKYRAIVEDIKKNHFTGRPVLVGAGDINEAEKISRLLIAEQITHTLLTAKNKEEEALIIALAGKKNAITVSTNMAGRGTDIILEEGVNELGGLRVIGTCKCDNIRIENQLRGRAGRQGDNGSSIFYLSLDEPMIALAESCENRFRKLDLSKPKHQKKAISIINSFQKSFSSVYFDTRKRMYEDDQILQMQRLMIYKQRDEMLSNYSVQYCVEKTAEIFKDIYHPFLEKPFKKKSEKVQIEEIKRFFNKNIFQDDEITVDFESTPELHLYIGKKIENNINLKIIQHKKEIDILIKDIFLKTIDENWIYHMDNVEDLKYTYAYKQDKKLADWNIDVDKSYQQMMRNMKIEILKKVYHL